MSASVTGRNEKISTTFETCRKVRRKYDDYTIGAVVVKVNIT